LIRKEKDETNQGLPLLARIPLIGFLFGKNTRTDERRELIFLLTPHIITDENQSKTVTDEFKEKLEGLKKDLDQDKKSKEK